VNPRLAIVIVNFNARDWLQGCLRSIYEQDIVEDLEVVVVDSASTDDSVKMVRREFPLCKLIASKENLGFGRGNNMGAAQCEAPMLLFLNPDTEVSTGALTELLSFMEQNPQYGAAGGKIYDGDGELERSAGTWPTILSLILDRLLMLWPQGRERLEHLAHHYWNYDELREVEWVTGAYLWIRRDLFDRIEGFDRDIFMYYEDVDLCYRLRQAGSQVCFFPGASIVHYRNKAPIEDKHRKRLMLKGLHQFSLNHYAWRYHGMTRLISYFSYRFMFFHM
jgi:GT2 family glycosyltransferase